MWILVLERVKMGKDFIGYLGIMFVFYIIVIFIVFEVVIRRLFYMYGGIFFFILCFMENIFFEMVC